MEDIIRLVAEENLLLLADEVGAILGLWGGRAPTPGPTEPRVLPQVLQENVATSSCPFLSFKRVLWEMGDPFTSTVQLISFYSLSKSVAGE